MTYQSRHTARFSQHPSVGRTSYRAFLLAHLSPHPKLFSPGSNLVTHSSTFGPPGCCIWFSSPSRAQLIRVKSTLVSPCLWLYILFHIFIMNFLLHPTQEQSSSFPFPFSFSLSHCYFKLFICVHVSLWQAEDILMCHPQEYYHFLSDKLSHRPGAHPIH